MGEERKKALMAWVRKHRPDCVGQVETLIATFDAADGKMVEATYFMMVLSFEAGRMIQSLNPELPYDEVLVGPPIQKNLRYE